MDTVTMTDIEARAKAFAEARNELAQRLQHLRDELENNKRRRMQGIKNALARVTAAHDELRTGLEDGKALFEKPKTRVLHGVRVGWMKQPGKIDIADVGDCVARLRKQLGDEADAYIKTTEAPIRSALANLPAKDLKRYGIALTDDVDAVVIKPADGDIDKLIAALINDADLQEVAS